MGALLRIKGTRERWGRRLMWFQVAVHVMQSAWGSSFSF